MEIKTYSDLRDTDKFMFVDDYRNGDYKFDEDKIIWCVFPNKYKIYMTNIVINPFESNICLMNANKISVEFISSKYKSFVEDGTIEDFNFDRNVRFPNDFEEMQISGCYDKNTHEYNIWMFDDFNSALNYLNKQKEY